MALALGPGLMLWPAAGRAHLGHLVLGAERYVKFDVTPEGLRLVVSLVLGPAETARVMQRADEEGDGNGVVSPDEARRHVERWTAALADEMPVLVDGEPVRASWGESFFDATGPVGSRSEAAVEAVVRVPLESGERRIQVRDRMRAETFDRTDVSFVARDGARLLVAGLGERPERLETDLAIGRPLAQRLGDRLVYSATVEVPGGSWKPTPWLLVPLLVATAALAVRWLFRLGRRRRQTPRGSKGVA